jgi:hypothetical protein
MDWHSRYVLAWRLSNTLDEEFCLEALAEALSKGRPEIFNTDQGAQFTSRAFTGLLEQHGARVSMDGKGRYTVIMATEAQKGAFLRQLRLALSGYQQCLYACLIIYFIIKILYLGHFIEF